MIKGAPPGGYSRGGGRRCGGLGRRRRMWLYTRLLRVQKRKRRSPAAEARGRQRLLQWQQKRDRHRLQLESRNTPHRSIETSKTWTRLTKRLENKHILNTSKGGGADLGAGGGGAAGKTVLYCNQTKTIVHPQLLQSPLSSFSPVTSSSSGISDSRWQAGCSNCQKNM